MTDFNTQELIQPEALHADEENAPSRSRHLRYGQYVNKILETYLYK